MIRSTIMFLLAAGLAVTSAPCAARTAHGLRHTRKATNRHTTTMTAPASGGIDTPSTDFSKIEPAGEEPSGPKGSTFRPTMGAGGMGLGAGF